MYHVKYTELPYKIDNAVKDSQTFFCEMVDLKRNGYLHLTKALNNLTYGFWRPWLDETDKYIENLAEDMKLTIRNK
jgi:hypothetical protein